MLFSSMISVAFLAFFAAAACGVSGLDLVLCLCPSMSALATAALPGLGIPCGVEDSVGVEGRLPAWHRIGVSATVGVDGMATMGVVGAIPQVGGGASLGVKGTAGMPRVARLCSGEPGEGTLDIVHESSGRFGAGVVARTWA